MAAVDVVHLDGYVVRTLMRDLLGHDRRPAAFVVYVWIAAETQTDRCSGGGSAMHRSRRRRDCRAVQRRRQSHGCCAASC